MYVVLIGGSGEEKYIVCTKKGEINASPSSEELVREIETSYNTNHARGYEASMSACIHGITFQPVVVQIPDTIGELTKLVESTNIWSIRSVSGFYSGVKLKKDAAEELMKTAIRPRLITEDFDRIKADRLSR